ncbi:MAG: hypothetical protein H6719_02175 [Sandaracinaceae bacterium]|nr:hypothetical protein [Myxococcales bacterium]MCB9591515.1 hypothetical protein [Sandaracinaceae bacterium]
MSVRNRRGLSLVEAALIVCLVGIVLAVFIPTFVRELRTSKTSEAVDNLALLSRQTAAYFVTPQPREDGPAMLRCLPPTAGPTPRLPTEEPEEVDFQAEDTPGHETWAALGFHPTDGVRYAYTFEPTASRCGLRSPEGSYLVTLRAEGDLDGDGERSLFELRLRAEDSGDLVEEGILYVRDRAE